MLYAYKVYTKDGHQSIEIRRLTKMIHLTKPRSGRSFKRFSTATSYVANYFYKLLIMLQKFIIYTTKLFFLVR